MSVWQEENGNGSTLKYDHKGSPGIRKPTVWYEVLADKSKRSVRTVVPKSFSMKKKDVEVFSALEEKAWNWNCSWISSILNADAIF